MSNVDQIVNKELFEGGSKAIYQIFFKYKIRREFTPHKLQLNQS